MTYVTKSCPHCGHSYSIGQPKNSATYGSPFQRCKFCDKMFIDADMREIAVSGVRPVDYRKASTNTVVLFVFSALLFFGMFICCILADFDTSTLLPLALLGIYHAVMIYLLIDEIREYPKRIKYLSEETLRSEARLNNPDYAKALKQIGYAVPAKYLK